MGHDTYTPSMEHGRGGVFCYFDLVLQAVVRLYLRRPPEDWEDIVPGDAAALRGKTTRWMSREVPQENTCNE